MKFCCRTFENRIAKAASFLAFCVCRIPNGKCYQIRSFISLKGLSTRSKGKEDFKSVSSSDFNKFKIDNNIILKWQKQQSKVRKMPIKFVNLYLCQHYCKLYSCIVRQLRICQTLEKCFVDLVLLLVLVLVDVEAKYGDQKSEFSFGRQEDESFRICLS